MHREVRDAMRQRICLAGTRAGDDQPRARAKALLPERLAMGHRLALRSVQLLEMRGLRHDRAIYDRRAPIATRSAAQSLEEEVVRRHRLPDHALKLPHR